MSKKLILACMAVAAFAAFVLPATASAGAALCETEAGVCKTIPTGVAIEATSEGPTKFVSGGTTLVECSTATMTGTLLKNGPVIEGNISVATFTGTEAGGKCKSSFGGATAVDTNIGNGVPYCLKSVEGKDEWTLRGNSCTLASRSITFVLTTTNIGTCKYNRTTPITGHFNTHEVAAAQATLTATPGTTTEFTKEEGSFLCPSTGSLDMKFILETENAAATPLYIETSP